MDTEKTTATSQGGGSRRKFLGDVAAALAGSFLPLGPALAAGYEQSGATDGMPGAAGTSCPPGDVRHYGIVPNVTAAASANTAALKALVDPAGTFTGALFFPNTTGSEVYYFNDLIAFHDGIHLDLRNSTLSFTKNGVKRDSASGFIHAIRDFVIENAREQERHTAQAINFRVTNLTVMNVTNEAFGAMGAFDIVIDDLHVTEVGDVCLVGSGESLYFRPWIPSGDRGKRPSFTVRNVVGDSIRNLGIQLTGASSISGSYLDNPPAHDNPSGIGPDRQSDLIDFVLDRLR
jgi:hypothetical protein